MNILITGCRGFIGGSLGRFAVRQGHNVFGTGRSHSPDPTWPGKYFQSELETNEVVELLNRFELEVLVHAAGSSSVAASVSDPACDLNASAMSFARVLEAVRRSDIRPVIILISSAAVVGNPDNLPVSEEAKIRPLSPYGFHKAMCELLAREYSECFHLNVIICRLFSVFGFAQRRLLVWELFSQLASSESTAWLEGTGSESRDFLYIEDVVAALLGLANLPTRSGECAIVNVASGIETNVMALARQIRDLVAPEKEIQCRNLMRKNDPLRWCADIAKLNHLLPMWNPLSLHEGLALCIAEWSRNSEHAS